MQTLIEILKTGATWIGISLVAGFFLAIWDISVTEPLMRKMDKKRRKEMEGVPYRVQAEIKRLGLGLLMMAVIATPAWAEVQRHVQNADGTISVTIERTAQEQQMQDNAYDMPDGSQMFFINQDTGQAQSREKHNAQVTQGLNMVRSFNNQINKEAKEALKDGVIDEEEYFKIHGQLQMANTGLSRTRNEIVRSTQGAVPHRQVEKRGQTTTYKIVKPRVLVSG